MLNIIIQTDADFTPSGKRSARVVQTDRGGRQLSWYVSGKLYRRLPVNEANADLTRAWLAA